jgi:hypothetical protein
MTVKRTTSTSVKASLTASSFPGWMMAMISFKAASFLVLASLDVGHHLMTGVQTTAIPETRTLLRF